MKAVYPGSFDPITCGHIDILKRIKTLFDEVVILVLNNPKKKHTFSLEDRLDMIRGSLEEYNLSDIEYFSHTGLLVDFVKKNKPAVIVRGLRVLSDFDYEFQMALANKNLAKDIETIFIPTSDKYMFLSSSLVKEIASYGGDISNLVPHYVKNKLQEFYGTSSM